MIGIINFYTGRKLEKVKASDEMYNEYIDLLLNGIISNGYICMNDTLYISEYVY
ncbi:MAG: hypothetical protein HFJ54_00980 [Clostridia bacterium]|nr:hypothetical protein [Clostridia bacterium]